MCLTPAGAAWRPPVDDYDLDLGRRWAQPGGPARPPAPIRSTGGTWALPRARAPSGPVLPPVPVHSHSAGRGIPPGLCPGVRPTAREPTLRASPWTHRTGMRPVSPQWRDPTAGSHPETAARGAPNSGSTTIQHRTGRRPPARHGWPARAPRRPAAWSAGQTVRRGPAKLPAGPLPTSWGPPGTVPRGASRRHAVAGPDGSGRQAISCRGPTAALQVG